MIGLSKVLAFVAVVVSIPVAAHTTSLGFVPGSLVGTVTFWTGSYEHGGLVANEGSVTLTGVSVVYNNTQAFNIAPVTVKPIGLVDGTNNFFWGPSSGGVYPFPLNTDPNLFGGVVHWQGVTFTGLSAGTYTFGCGTTCGVTQQWDSLNGNGDVVKLTLSAGDVGGGVPEPAMWTMMLAGFGLVGTAMRRRHQYTLAA